MSFLQSAPSVGTGERYVWNTWTGTGTISYSETDNPATDAVTMNSAITETASWTHQYYLTVTDGGHSSVSGAGWYDTGVTAYASVTDSIVEAKSSTRYIFNQWTGDASGTHIVSDGILMDASKTTTATWITQYELIVYITGNGTVEKDPNQTFYDSGTMVHLTAIPDGGWNFVEWTGDLTGDNNPDSIRMTSEKTVTATFAINYYTLAVNVTGSGSVDKVPSQASYTHGTWVHLTANPAVGWHFVNWADSLTGANNPDSILMNTDKVVTANFAINTYTLTVDVSGSGSVELNPATGPYNHGTYVHLTANPAMGWHFINWTDSLVSIHNPDSILMNSNKVVTANFAINTYTLTVNVTGSGSVELNPATGPYNHGTWVHLTAIPAVGWHFVNWTDSLTGTHNPDSILMNSDKVVTANFAINTYTLTVDVSGSGSVDLDPATGPYNYGTWVHLTANPALGWHFVNWSGNLTGTNNPDSILMNGDKTVTATFAINTYTLHIDTVGNGGVTLNPSQSSYTHGTWVHLIANPALGWHFVNWSGDLTGSNNPDSIYMDGTKTVTATFAINTYNLTVNVTGSGSVVLNPATGPYNYGTYVHLTANPAMGWHFVNWTDSLTGANNPDSILMNSNKVVTAHFVINTYTLNVITVGSGTVVKLPATGPYNYGTWVHLTANPAMGWHFVNWTDSLTGTHNPDSILMNSNKVVTANFAINTYTLNITVNGSGNVEKNPDQTTYDYGTSVELNANPAMGWHFIGWTGDITSTDNPLTVIMDNNKNLTATFEIDTFILTVSVTGSGSVNKDPEQSSYDYGTWVHLTAMPEAGSHFINWTGDLTGSNNPDSLYMNQDMTVTAHFAITETPSWVSKESMPSQVAGKYVADGGALVSAGGTKDGDVIYGFRGKSREFYMYTPGTPGTWTSMDSVPNGKKPTDPTKINKKVVAKGASMCFDGDHIIYATKGNGTKEFWAYDIAADSDHWTAKAFVSVPKGLKGGTSIIWFNGKVYLLAGNQKKTDVNNFFGYDPAGDTINGTPWSALASIGLGPKTNVWKDGACITELNGVIYAMKSNDKPNYFFSYDTGLNTWTQLTNDSIPPFEHLLTNSVSKLKKIYVKDGAAMVNDGSVIYATKGGGYNFMWQYTPGIGWTSVDSVPRLWKKSVIKTGGAMTYANGAIWLLKGNKSPEYWKYIPSSSVVASVIPITVSATMVEHTTTATSFSFDVTPNPFTTLTTIRYTVPVSGKVSIKLYNAIGNVVETVTNEYLNAGTYTIHLSANTLAKGVYFLKYSDATNTSELKLIVQ